MGRALANSYYVDQHGDVSLRPMSTVEAAWRAGHFNLGDYRFERVGAPSAARVS